MSSSHGSVFRRRRTLKLRKRLIVLAMAGTITAGIAAAATSASADDIQYGAIWSAQVDPVNPGRCLDVTWSQNVDGTPIQLYKCNGTTAQAWSWHWQDGSFVNWYGKCLDVANGSTADGAQVRLWDCNGTGAQQWVPWQTGEIYNPQSGKCLDAKDWGSTDGTQLQIWTCTGGLNQKWRMAIVPGFPGFPS
jgi:Ricin-type beta-trefoil lectin domain